jgi:hypothetical protein
MPDEATPEAPINGTPPEPKETPETGAPPEGQTESPDSIDWKQRYEDLRPEADRRASLLADIEGRNGPDRQAAALAEHARIELEAEEAEEPDDEFDLPPDPLDEIETIKQQLAERDQAAEQAEFDQLEAAYIESTVDELADKASLKLNDDEYEVVVNFALANRDPHDGKPALEGGIAKLKAIKEASRQDYLQSKDDTILAPVGTEGEPKINLRDKQARQKLGTEVYEAAQRAKTQ